MSKETLPFNNLQDIMPELEAAYDNALLAGETGVVKAFEDGQRNYNKVAYRAALALHEDTKDRNSLDIIMQAFASKDRDGWCPHPKKFKRFLEV